jgi:hypothetical protein
MSDYRQEGTGKVVTEEKVAKLAKAGGYTVEEYIEAAKLTLITDNVDKSDFQQGSATGVNVLSNNQTTPTGTDSGLDDTFSELPKTDPDPDPELNPFNQKYIDFVSGYDASNKRRIYEDEYAESMAGQQYDRNGRTGVYPKSFEEYAESINTSLKQDKPSELGEEIVIKTKTSDVVREAKKAAEGARAVVDAKTEVSEKSDIGINYFNLVESRGVRGRSELTPDVPRETKVVGRNKRGREITEYVNDYETDLKNSFGSEAKYNQWKNLEKKLGDEALNKDNLKDLFNLEDEIVVYKKFDQKTNFNLNFYLIAIDKYLISDYREQIVTLLKDFKCNTDNIDDWLNKYSAYYLYWIAIGKKDETIELTFYYRIK